MNRQQNQKAKETTKRNTVQQVNENYFDRNFKSELFTPLIEEEKDAYDKD